MNKPYLDLWLDVWFLQVRTELMTTKFEAMYDTYVGLRVTLFNRWGFRFSLYSPIDYKERRHVKELEARLKKVEALVVSGFYEDAVPSYKQGLPTHELEDIVTAQDCTSWIAKIIALEKANKGANENKSTKQ